MLEENNAPARLLLEKLVSEVKEFVIVLLDKQRNFITWNPGVERTIGYARDEFVGKPAAMLLPAADRERGDDRREFAEAEAKGRSSDSRWLVTKAGEPIYVDGITVALHDDRGETIAFGKVFRDITERLRNQHEFEAANERLNKLAQELERSNAELEQFARIASHDLSAPITSTRWIVDQLAATQGGKLDGNGHAALAQISSNLERMSDLIDAVLAHAQVGRTSIHSASVTSCTNAIRNALDNLERDVVSSEGEFTWDPLPRVNVESQALTQLFQNLLSNAIKYRRPDAPLRVHISAKWEDPMWVVSVRDNGVGIEARWFDRVFLPLQRLHGREIPGSGIGLATCKKIVDRVGGRIWIESEVGAGSSFFMTLPGPPPPVPEASGQPVP